MIENTIKSYKDISEYIKVLKRELELSQNIVEHCKGDIKYYQKQMDLSKPHDISSPSYDAMPHGNYSPVDLDRCYSIIHQSESMISLEEDRQEGLKKDIAEYEKKKKDIDNMVKGMDNPKIKAKWLHETAHLTYTEIGDLLGYSECTVRNHLMRNNI